MSSIVSWFQMMPRKLWRILSMAYKKVAKKIVLTSKVMLLKLRLLLIQMERGKV
jgi:hypothetical protein